MLGGGQNWAWNLPLLPPMLCPKLTSLKKFYTSWSHSTPPCSQATRESGYEDTGFLSKQKIFLKRETVIKIRFSPLICMCVKTLRTGRDVRGRQAPTYPSQTWHGAVQIRFTSSHRSAAKLHAFKSCYFQFCNIAKGMKKDKRNRKASILENILSKSSGIKEETWNNSLNFLENRHFRISAIWLSSAKKKLIK